MLSRPRISPVNRLNPLRVLGTHPRPPRRDPGRWELLDEALALAEGTGEPQWIVPVRAARAELQLAGGPARTRPGRGRGRLRAARRPASTRGRSGPLAIWLPRLGRPPAGDSARRACPSRSRWRRPATGGPRPRPGTGSAGPTTRRWPGSARRTRPACGRRWPCSTSWAPGPPRRWPGGGCGTRHAGDPARAAPATRAAPAGLTAREQEVLVLLSEGLADREISRRLFISERTVHHHVSAVLAKIGVSSRTAAAREAARMGIGPAT